MQIIMVTNSSKCDVTRCSRGQIDSARHCVFSDTHTSVMGKQAPKATPHSREVVSHSCALCVCSTESRMSPVFIGICTYRNAQMHQYGYACIFNYCTHWNMATYVRYLCIENPPAIVMTSARAMTRNEAQITFWKNNRN